MADLSFDQAYQRLRTTMPDAEFYEVEKHGEVDEYGLPTGAKVASVVCYDSRLTNAVWKFGGWTFLIDNRFITFAVQKVAMTWLLHKGGTRYGEQELVRALRHCFKRFYAESLVALAEPPVGRAMLLESVLFERRYIDEILNRVSDEGDPDAASFNGTTFEVARHAIFICQRHEIGHYLLSQPGETLIDNTRKLLDGVMEPAIQYLIDQGNVGLAEEAFCDAFALNSIVKTERYYDDLARGASLYDAVHLDEVRAASFCYAITMQLSRIWFRALQDARAGWDAAEQGAGRPDDGSLHLDVEGHRRSHLVSSMVDLYIRSKNGDIHSRDANFYFNPRYSQLIAQAASNLDALAPADAFATATEAERELARYLTGAMWLANQNGQYLIDVARDREWSGWSRLDEGEAEAEDAPLATVEDALNSRAEVKAAQAAADMFWEAMKGFFAEYAKVFDAIVAEVMFSTAIKPGTVDRLEAFKADICARIDTFGHDQAAFSSILANDYCVAERTNATRKIAEAHLNLLTIMQRCFPKNADMAFDTPIKDRLLAVEAYAARNRGANVAAFAALILPELETGRLVPTTLL